MSRIRIPDSDWAKHLWSRVLAIFNPLEDRVAALEQGGGGGGVVTIDHGGTGQTNATDAITALHGVRAFRLNTATWAAIFAEFDVIPKGEAAMFYSSADVTYLMTGQKVNATLKAFVVASPQTAGEYDIFGWQASGQLMYGLRIQGLTSASATPTSIAVFAFQGTAL